MALSASLVRQDVPPGRQLRNQLAAAVRSINWSYAFFWSISNAQPGYVMCNIESIFGAILHFELKLYVEV
jgi:hypothetical protein